MRNNIMRRYNGNRLTMGNQRARARARHKGRARARAKGRLQRRKGKLEGETSN